MKDDARTGEQLMKELVALRRKVADLEASEREHKRVEQALRQSEQRYRDLVETARDAIYTLSPDGTITSLNPAFETITGWSRSEWLGKSFAPLIHPDDLPSSTELFQRALQGETLPIFKLRILSRSGGYLIGEFLGAPQIEHGKVVGVLGVARDITERWRAEKALRQAEEKYRSLFENAVEGVFQTTPDGRFLTANPALANMCRYKSPEELVATVTNIEHQLYVEPGRRAEFIRLMEEHGAVSGFEFQAYRKDGSVMWISESVRAVRDESGAVRYYEGNVEDISERKRAEEALVNQTRELAVLEERNRMAREIHDTLAQGFTGIVLQLEAAEQASEESPAEVPEHLSRAKNLARECLQEARRSVWNLLPRALEERPLDAALQEEVRRFTAAGREKASFSVSGDRRELPSNVQAALLRICQESLTNVRRHARATEVRVNLASYPDAVCLGVQDNGIGFDIEAVKAAGRQSGLGLPGMEERARLLGGTLTIRSQKGKGTLVEVRIPAT